MRHARLAFTLTTALFPAACSSPPEPKPAKNGPEPPAAEPRGGPARVLFVERYPRWEYRLLKNALLRDRALAVDVFLVSADREFPQAGSDGRAPLAELALAKEDLADYDVVILGDVAPADLGSEAVAAEDACRNLVEWVHDGGGGLILIAGQQNLPALWKGTPLEPLLPVDAADPLPENEPGFALRLTDSGAEHAITTVAPDRTATIEAWEDRDGKGDGLRAPQWVAPTRAKPAGDTLVECDAAGRSVPVFVAAHAGRGRVFFSATDETWRWRFVSGDEPWFGPFWRRAIAWVKGAER
jgi:hypothetical protein